MKKLKVLPGFDCEICHDEGKYEVMHLGHNGEPQYLMQACECTIQEHPFGHVPVRAMDLMEQITVRTNVIEMIAKNALNSMVWHKGQILSPSLPDVKLAF